MVRKVLLVGLITLLCSLSVLSQDDCDHKSLIMSFLQKISSVNYLPTLQDYNVYFDKHSEIEIALREEYSLNHSNSDVTDSGNSKSFAIDKLLKNDIMCHLINLKNSKNCKWRIGKSYNYGSATIIYEVGIDCSSEILKIQMSNWAYKDRCKIDDILDSGNKSILIKNRILKLSLVGNH